MGWPNCVGSVASNQSFCIRATTCASWQRTQCRAAPTYSAWLAVTARWHSSHRSPAGTALPSLSIDVRFTPPSGQEAAGAQLLLVSNNPYELAQLRGGGTREHLDGGTLGIVYVRVASAADAERLAALEVAGQVQRFAAWSEWTAPQFEVRSGGPVEIGIDGEAMILEPPLRFVIRPQH